VSERAAMTDAIKARLSLARSSGAPLAHPLYSAGEADIPTFFDGPVDHDQYYPSKGIGSGVDVSSLGEGCLMFDFDGMMKRQAVMLAEVEKESEKEQGK